MMELQESLWLNNCADAPRKVVPSVRNPKLRQAWGGPKWQGGGAVVQDL